MYEVSKQYKAAMKSEVQQFHISGTIGDVLFDDENILSGSFSIANQCSGSDLVSIGQVYIGELNATFLNVNIPRYNWKGQEIKPFFSQKLEDGTYETIPLGIFTIDQAEWTTSGVVVKAYDHMALLDRACVKTLKNGTAFEMATIACEECGVELGTSEDEFKKFPNGTEILGEYEENDVETWRDLFSWLSQTLACFVTADRFGRIIFKMYSDEPVDVIDDRHRFKGASFSDYETRYTGLSCVNIPDKSTSYYSVETDDALTYNLGSNPFLQYGMEETRNEMREAVLYGLQSICYVPFKVAAIGNPAYDLGDVLIFSGGIADQNKKYCITRYSFKYNGTYEMEGVGQNPALASAKSKSDKNLVGLMSEVANQGMKYYVLRNVEDINVSDGEKKMVFPAQFVVAKESHVRINIEVLLDVDVPEIEDEEADEDEKIKVPDEMTCTMTYYLDGEEMTDRYPIETWRAGRHILTLQYDVSGAEAMIHSFNVWMECKGGSIFIEKLNFYEVIFGDGLAAQAGWDGKITAYDDYDIHSLDNIFGRLTDVASTRIIPFKRQGVTDGFVPVDFGFILGELSDEPGVLRHGELLNITKTDLMTLSGVVANTEYFSGTGLLVTEPIEVDRINEMIIDVAEGTVTVMFSFDAGETWFQYEYGAWVKAKDNGMDSTMVCTISKEAWGEMLEDALVIKATFTKAKMKEIFIDTEED